MRVLHLPSNVASFPTHTIKGLRSIGIDAFGFVTDNPIINSSDELKVIDMSVSLWQRPHVWAYRQIRGCSTFLRLLMWADVIHWYPTNHLLPFYLDIQLIKLLNKPAVVEWLGADIRIPDMELLDNPYFKQAFQNGYEHPCESRENSIKTQKRFFEAGFLPIVAPCVMQYLQEDICPIFRKCMARIFLDDFIPNYPKPNVLRPIVVHAPSRSVEKGTSHVLNAIKILKAKYDFEFILVHGMPHQQTMQIIEKADIFLDQFVIGHYGMASIEAMAYGKPVVCYIKSSTRDVYPSDLPIVNANPNNLFQVLESLLQDSKHLYEIGKKSRAYVEKYHDAIKLAHQLKQIYHEAISLRKRCKAC